MNSITLKNNISLFKKILETIKNYSNIINIKFTKNNLELQIIDDIKINIINIILKIDYFEKFNIDFEILITLNINDLNKIFKMLNKTNIITLNLKKNNNILNIYSDYNENIKKIFKITLLDTNYEWINISNLNINNSLLINLESKFLYNIFNELNVFSNDLIIKKTNNEILNFIAEDKINNLYSEYKIKILNNIHNINLIISLSYLTNFKLLNNFKYSELYLSNDNPLYIKLNDDIINIDYIQAPKINDIEF